VARIGDKLFNPIAITGATGHLGRLVIDDLLTAGVPGTDLIAIVRDPDKALGVCCTNG
jgi:NAD(P)H dehydrogenase (quinone)